MVSNQELVGLKHRVRDMVERDDFSILFNEIRKDIAQRILQTGVNQKEERENLYLMSHGLTLLEMKLQEFANEFSKEND